MGNSSRIILFWQNDWLDSDPKAISAALSAATDDYFVNLAAETGFEGMQVIRLETGIFTGAYTIDEDNNYVFTTEGAAKMWAMCIPVVLAWVAIFWLIFTHERVTCFNYGKVLAWQESGSSDFGALRASDSEEEEEEEDKDHGVGASSEEERLAEGGQGDDSAPRDSADERDTDLTAHMERARRKRTRSMERFMTDEEEQFLAQAKYFQEQRGRIFGSKPTPGATSAGKAAEPNSEESPDIPT